MNEHSGEINPDGADNAPPAPLEYHVVMKTLTGGSTGVMTRTMFNDRSSFEHWYGGTMQDGTNRPLHEVYDVVARGISRSDAVRIIASPENTDAIISSLWRRLILS